MPIRTDAKGKTYPPHEYEVCKEKIREYARAVGEDNPLYFDRAQARAAVERQLRRSAPYAAWRSA